MENMQNIDPDGYINTQYYINASQDIIDRFIQDRQIDVNRITTNQMTAAYALIYRQLFRPEDHIKRTKKNILDYNTENISRLIDVYIYLCNYYGALPSLDGLATFSGIDEDTINEYLTPARSVIQKQRRAYIQNRLNDTPVGVIALANNDPDTGLLYTRQNMVASATVKKALSFNDLKAIATGDIKSND